MVHWWSTDKIVFMRNLDENKIEIIKILRENGVSYEQISKIINSTPHIVRGITEKNNVKPLINSKISSKDLIKISDQNISLNGLDKYRAGQISEYLVSAKLMSEGFEVYEPVLANQPADLIISKNNNFFKIQIKTARYFKDRNCYYSSVWQTRGIKKIPYSKKDTDFIIIKCSGIDAIYVFPVEYFKNRLNIQLYPNRNLKIKKKKKTDSEYYLNSFNKIK